MSSLIVACFIICGGYCVYNVDVVGQPAGQLKLESLLCVRAFVDLAHHIGAR